MFCKSLPSVTVYTKDGNVYNYIIETNINFEELNNYFKETYKDNLNKIILGQTYGYLHKV